MHCHGVPQATRDGRVEVLLVGPPNVGKSVIFNRLTGLSVSAANYAGTTVELARGDGRIGRFDVHLVDLPGTYTLSAMNEAEQVAVDMLERTDGLVVVVVDALHLESSLYLLLQVLAQARPTMVVVNRGDIAAAKGRAVDVEALSSELGVPVAETVAIRAHGFDALEAVLAGMIEAGEAGGFVRRPAHAVVDTEEWRWSRAAELAGRVSIPLEDRDTAESGASPRPPRRGKRTVPIAGKPARRGHRLTRLDSEALVRPWPGLPIAAVVLALAFGLIVGLGMGVRQAVLLPLARNGLFPAIESFVTAYVPGGIFQSILIGEYGFLIKGIEWPFTLVLPYVLSFYLAMSLLEDSGYLPRLAVLLDGALSKIGLRGSHSISLLLGYGCAIPGILSARAMGSRKERLIVATLISLAIPCISQTGALFALLAEASLWLVVALFALSFAVMIVTGLLLDRLLPGRRSQLVYEMPELLLPHAGILGKKLLLRARHYLFDGALPMVAAVAVAAVLYETGLLARIGEILSPLVTGLLRLPQEAAAPLILGIVRRELTVLPLLDMELTLLQLFTGAVVGLFYVPCIAVVATLAREFGARVAVALLLLTSAGAFAFGGVFAWGGLLFGL